MCSRSKGGYNGKGISSILNNRICNSSPQTASLKNIIGSNKMEPKIYTIHLGLDQCYLIKEEGTVLIDGGAPGKVSDFSQKIEALSIDPEEVALIILTHGHWDHIGSAKEIKEITGARIAMHQNDMESLEKGIKSNPPGATAWGKIVIRAVQITMPLFKIPSTSVDIVVGDEGLSLHEYGIRGEVIHTPGHSPGSISLLLETGDVFVGDLAMNSFPLRLTPGLPIFAEDMQQVKESWKLLLDKGAKTVYPAHGKPFTAEVIRSVL